MESEQNNNQPGPNNRCKGKTKNGRPCRAPATDSGLCFFHSNPNKASELGRMGGRQNRYSFVAEDRPPLVIESKQDVYDILSRLVNEVYSLKIPYKIVPALAALLNLQCRLISSTAIDDRIAKVEQMLAELYETHNSTSLSGQPFDKIATDRHHGLDDENSPNNDGFGGSS